MKKQKDSQKKKNFKFQEGMIYVVRLGKGTHADVLHVYTKPEVIIHSIHMITKTTLKVLLVLISIVIPPLLFVTIPMMRIRDE